MSLKNDASPPFDLRDDFAAFHSESFAWLEAHWLQIVIAIGVGTVIYLLLNLARSWGRKLCERGAGGQTWYAVIGRAIGRTSQWFIVLASARLVLGYSNAPPSVGTTITTLFTIAAVFQGALWTREIVFGAVEHKAMAQDQQNQALVSAMGIIRLLVTIALFAIALILVLGNLGVNVTGLVAGLGVGGIAIGLAAQGIFADLFAALAILFDRPFRLGDTISYDGAKSTGTVEQIGLKSTRIRGSAGEERILANKKLLDYEILNTTRRLRNRYKFEFSLGYATPPELVLRLPDLLRQAVEGEGYRLIHGGLNGFAADGLSYDVEFESASVDFPADARDKVAAAILARFRDAEVSFAEPAEAK